jgi:hypothetical protein
MRVTKLIREYVEKSVKAMPQFTEKSAEELEYERVDKAINDFKANLLESMQEMMKAEIAAFCVAQNIPEDTKLAPTNYNCVCGGMFNTKLGIEAQLKKTERSRKAQDAIDEILLSLELGADRKELEDMLKILREEA